MLSELQRNQLTPSLRTMQIIVGALALGIINFLLVVVFVIRPQGQGAPVGQPLLTYLAVGGAALAVIASFIVPVVLAGSMRKTTPDSSVDSKTAGAIEDSNILPLVQMYQTLLIIKCAILEGAAFFCLISHMIERQTITLVTTGVLLLVLLAQFPTRSRVEAWIESDLEMSELRRQLR